MEGLRIVGQDLTALKKRIYQERPARRSVRRPEQVIRDVRGLKLRQRVSLVLNDKILREELEDIVKSYSENGPRYQEIRAYQDFLVPTTTASFAGAGLPSMTVTPIADIRGTETLNYTKQERLLRCKVASVYRLIDILGWSQGIYNHITARTSTEEENFLINPFGLLYSEVSASSLVKVGLEGNILDEGRTSLGINAAGFSLHSVLHEARKDIKCIIHVHTSAGAAIAATKCGILPISQEALLLGEVSYHDYHGLVSLSEKEELVNNLGEKNKVMVLRNHGLIAVGETVEEAFHYIYHAVKACEIQVQAMPAGIDNLIKIESQDIQEEVPQNADKVISGKPKSKWGPGELQFEAFMRSLDAQGYNTGYAYHCPEMYSETKEKPSDAREPATITSFRYNLLYGPERERGNAARRLQSAGRANTYKNRAKWLNSPVKGTEYKKEKRIIEEEVPEVETKKDDLPEKVDKETEKPKEPKKVQINTESVVIKSSKMISHDDEPTTIVQEEKTVNQDGHEVTTIITTTTSSSGYKEVTTMVNGDDNATETDGDTSKDKVEETPPTKAPEDGNVLAVAETSDEPSSPKKEAKVKKTSSFKKAFKHLKIKKKEGKHE